MAYGEKNNNKSYNEIPTWHFYVCPKCWKKIEYDRRFCFCGLDVCAPHNGYKLPIHKIESLNPPEMLRKRNLDLQYFCCDACKGNCSNCASFSVPIMNAEGYGSVDCKHKRDLIRCRCCQLMIQYHQSDDADIAIKKALSDIGKIFDSGNQLKPEVAA